MRRSTIQSICVACRVLSSTLKMSDILECNVSVVEDLHKKREPMPLAGVYFIQPTSSSIAQLIEDFSGSTPLYPSVHIFFSSKVLPQLAWHGGTQHAHTAPSPHGPCTEAC